MSLHSMDDGIWVLAIILRCAANASQRITINSSREMKESMAPTVEMTFHIVMASG